jgi:hypothetical protein
MLSSKTPGYHRRVDKRPGSNIPSRYFVCRSSEAAFKTNKIISRLPVGLADISATRAFPGRIAGVNKNHGDTNALGFIIDKASQLEKSPVTQSCPLVLPGRYPLTDTAQVFKGNSRRGALRIGHNRFGYAMVDIFLKSSLSTRNLLELPLGGFSALALKITPTVREFAPILVDRFPAVASPVRISSDVDHTKVNTEYVRGGDKRRLVNVANASEVKFAANKHQIDFALTKGEELPLILAHDIRDFKSSRDCPNRYNVFLGKTNNPFIVGLGRIWSKMPLSFTVQFISIGNFSNTSYGSLRSQSKLFPNPFVCKLVHVVLSENTRFESLGRKPIASIIASRERLTKHGRLVFVGPKLYVGYELHTSSIEYSQPFVKRKERRFLPRPKGRGFRAEVL